MDMSHGRDENRVSAMRGVIIRENPRMAEFGPPQGSVWGFCCRVKLEGDGSCTSYLGGVAGIYSTKGMWSNPAFS